MTEKPTSTQAPLSGDYWGFAMDGAPSANAPAPNAAEARIAGPDEMVVPKAMTEDMFYAALRVYDDDEKMNAIKLWEALLAAAQRGRP